MLPRETRDNFIFPPAQHANLLIALGYSYLIFAIAVLILSACTQLQPARVSDRLGIVKLTVPGHWYDDTSQYLAELNRISANHPPDSGIQSLLMLKRRDHLADCKFRELRYTSNEVGYAWDFAKLASEIAYVRNRVLMGYGINHYLEYGLSVPCCDSKRSDRAIRIAFEAIKLNGQYNGWQTTHKHWFGKDTADRSAALTITAIIGSNQAKNNSPTFFIAAECAVDAGNEALLESVEQDVWTLLHTMSLNQ